MDFAKPGSEWTLTIVNRKKHSDPGFAGSWLSKAFSRHVEAVADKPEKGKFGFHSLRKTVVQGLQSTGVIAELRVAYVGLSSMMNTMVRIAGLQQ